MGNKKLIVTHTADIQVKNRNVNLFEGTQKTLFEIENHVEEQKAKIHIISGDLFEYATPNDSERKLIYNHISRLLQIESLEEIVIIAGNHDLEKERKQLDTQVDYNPISIFTDVIKYFDTDKIIYCAKSGLYESQKFNVRYIAYSLEDTENWDKIKNIVPNDERINICLYHAMLREYVDYKKLPLQPSVLNKLDTMELFPENCLIAAGDIHENHSIINDNDTQIFIYPGAPMEHTFGEGTYITFGERVKHSTTDKFIENYELFENGHVARILPIRLEKQITYNTISFDINECWDVVSLNLVRYLEDKISIGKVQTFVKVKSSNIFINHQDEIYQHIKRVCGDNKVSISFEYDKFVQTNSFVDNKIIQDLIDEKSKNFEDSQPTISASNINDLILDTNQIKLLFESVLKNMVENISDKFESNVTEETIHEEILNLFMEELQVTTEKSSKCYDIKFNNIITNGFMALGENNIKLDVDGITRILGTNGIGKTTLYRMLRWVLTGQIFEGMSNNQVVKNNLLVFNKKMIDIDDVNVSLDLLINNQKVVLIRNVKRVWKQNTTDENKLEQDWQKYITNVTRNFVMEIFGEDSEGNLHIIKTLNGEQAEEFVSKIFGSTINNILFMNQIKIEQMLKSNSDVLNELILQYIGVDYLDKLEANLDIVKTRLLEIGKPKRKYNDITEGIIDTKIEIKNCTSKIDELNLISVNNKNIIKNLKDDVEIINGDLINLGNIKSLLDSEKEKLTELENKDYTPKDKKIKPTWDIVKPTIDLSKLNNDKELFEQEVTKLKQDIDTLEIEYNKKYTEISTAINKIVLAYKTKQTEKELEISHNDDEIKNQLNLVYEYLKSIRDKYHTEHKEISDIINKQENTLSTIKDKEDKINEQLKSGVCSECGKPFSDDWEHSKTKLEENLKLLQDFKDKANEVIKENTPKQFEIGKNILLFDSYIKMVIENNYDLFDKDITDIDKFKDIINNLKNNNNELTQTINNYKEIIDLFNNYELLEHKNLSLIDNIEPMNINKNWFINIKDLLFSLKDINIKITDNKNNKIGFENLLNSKIEDISNKNNDYIEQTKKYDEEYKKYLNVCENIEQENIEIDKYNNSLISEQSNINLIKKEIENLELKLPKYNELLDSKELLNSNINDNEKVLDETIKDIELHNIKKNNFENNLKNLNGELEHYYQYEKNNVIWKIYSKLIKTNFKDVVFEYYRTFLNNTLNHLLSDVNFKLYWNKNSELTMISIDNGIVTYQNVSQASGMETTFLGLALIYTIQTLNVKNIVSHLFIDELSGTLNKGNELSYQSFNYQELFVKILSKFVDKSIFIIDHNIENIGEQRCYEVLPDGKTSKYILK